jgi:hypothetical protein
MQRFPTNADVFMDFSISAQKKAEGWNHFAVDIINFIRSN